VLSEGRIEAAQAEHDAVDNLIAKHPDASVSMTRRDEGNTGPLLVHVDDDTYVVTEDGKTRKLKAT
jgi:hypothetical protein